MAYDMRISDWSSDLCSSDLLHRGARENPAPVRPRCALELFDGDRRAGCGDRTDRGQALCAGVAGPYFRPARHGRYRIQGPRRPAAPADRLLYVSPRRKDRSEEHTSELQSLMRISYAVFCLKKKTKN